MARKRTRRAKNARRAVDSTGRRAFVVQVAAGVVSGLAVSAVNRYLDDPRRPQNYVLPAEHGDFRLELLEAELRQLRAQRPGESLVAQVIRADGSASAPIVLQ